MTCVVTENGIKSKYMDCVEVYLADCVYVGEKMLGIHSDECIDCGAVDRTLYLHTEQVGAPLGSLAWMAVDETFCTCVTGPEDVVEHHLSTLHAALFSEVLQRAEKRLGETSQAGTVGPSVPLFSGPEHG